MPVRADYEQLAILLALLFPSSNAFLKFLEIGYNDIFCLLSCPCSYLETISESVRLLDRAGYINNKFFQLLLENSSSNHQEIKIFSDAWLNVREIPRNMIDRRERQPEDGIPLVWNPPKEMMKIRIFVFAFITIVISSLIIMLVCQQNSFEQERQKLFNQIEILKNDRKLITEQLIETISMQADLQNLLDDCSNSDKPRKNY